MVLHTHRRKVFGNKDEEYMRVVVIGSGNVAESLAQAVAEAEGLELVQLFARNEERGRKVAELAKCEWSNTRLAEADLYLISVSDNAVSECAKKLHTPENAVVAHTAGCCTLDTLAPHTHRAVFYPFQTFSVGREVDFSKIFLFIEAEDSATHAAATEFAKSLTPNVADADSVLRSKIHLVGVLASNFVNNMYATATEVLEGAGLTFDVIEQIITEVAAKAVASADPAAVQTGPAMRGDVPTMERHRELIGDNPLLRTIYDKISENIWRIRETSKR